MGFNYLQTDDRDDYFKRFDKKKNDKPPTEYELFNENKELIFSGDSQECGRFIKKRFGLTARWGRYGRWRLVINEKGYSFRVKHTRTV